MFIPLNNGIKLNTRIYGENNFCSLLFFHGSYTVDDKVVNSLSKNYKVILIDEETINLDSISLLISELNIDNCFLIGYKELCDILVEFVAIKKLDCKLFFINPIISSNNIEKVRNRVILIDENENANNYSFFNCSHYLIDNYFSLESIITNEIKYDILFEDNHVLVVDKPCGILSQSDITKEKDILSIYKEYLVWRYKKNGDAYLGLVQRLDKNVSGILVLSKSTKAHTRLNANRPKKCYLAVVYGRLEKEEGTIISKLSKDEKNHVSYIDNLNGKESILHYKVLKYKNNFSLLEIEIDTGRFHQIRCQMSSIGHSIYNDKKYNKSLDKIDTFALGLDSYKVSFIHPISKEKIEISRIPNRDIFKQFTD